MMAEIIVSHGLCSAIRPKVLTALEPYQFKDLRVQAWGEGRYGTDDTHTKTSDDFKLAKTHYARVTVSDASVKWAEWLLWQSGQFVLESKPHQPGLNWVAPLDCKEQSSLGRGTMPTPWSASKGKPPVGKPKQPAKAARQVRPPQRKQTRRSSILDFFRRL